MGSVLDLVINASQTKWLLNLENLLAEYDVRNEQNDECATRKQAWLNTWRTNAYNTYVDTFNTRETSNLCSFFCSMSQLLHEGDKLFAADSESTWYYIVILEAHLFQPYTPLSESEDKKRWKGLSYDSKDYLKTIVDLHGKIPNSFISRIDKAYKKAVGRIQGRGAKFAVAMVVTAALTGLTYGLAAQFAPAIAVILVGSNFATHGMALTLQCLAYLGGGAIAIGGGGVVAGTAIIAGGGALLGAAVGGAASMTTASLILASPEATLFQAAKMEVTFKEILLNEKDNIEAAKQIVDQYEEQITKLRHMVVDLEREATHTNQKQVSSLLKTTNYLLRSYKELLRFFSAYMEGVHSPHRQAGTNDSEA